MYRPFCHLLTITDILGFYIFAVTYYNSMIEFGFRFIVVFPFFVKQTH